MHRIKMSINLGEDLFMDCINLNQFKSAKEKSQRKKYENASKKFFSNGYYCSNSKEKLKFYNMAIKLNPNFVDAYFNRADLYKELKEYHKAIQDYNKILELDPKDKDCYNNRAIVYYLIKNMIKQ